MRNRTGLVLLRRRLRRGGGGRRRRGFFRRRGRRGGRRLLRADEDAAFATAFEVRRDVAQLAVAQARDRDEGHLLVVVARDATHALDDVIGLVQAGRQLGAHALLRVAARAIRGDELL